MAIAPAGRIFKGKTASPGYAHGPLVRANVAAPAPRPVGENEAEALRAALAATSRQLSALAAATGSDAAAILEFQMALIEDGGLLEPIFAAIEGGAAADEAWSQAMAAEIAEYRGAVDDYLRARSADLVDLRDRVVATLSGDVGGPSAQPPAAVVFAEDLPPSRFLEIDWSEGGGLALSRGSATSHVAMLARARGVPMLVQLGEVPETAAAALLDGEHATLELDPPASRINSFESRRAIYARDGAVGHAVLAGPPAVSAGERVRLMINIQGTSDLLHPNARYADGVGLMRTEFLFEGRTGLPDEEAQLQIYESVLRWAGQKPVTIRTVDAGGDKPIPGFTEDGEANPFLGVRGLRLSLRHPEIFAVQLRALARAAVLGNLRVMFPMVTAPDEFETASALFSRVVGELKGAGVPAALPELGIMVEVPAAALTIEEFPASFFSIGSNDLTQYVTACDRTNDLLASLANPLNPGVLELIRRTVESGRRRKLSVSLCGDMAGEPRYVAELLRCGLRELSMSPPSLARVKLAITVTSPELNRV